MLGGYARLVYVEVAREKNNFYPLLLQLLVWSSYRHSLVIVTLIYHRGFTLVTKMPSAEFPGLRLALPSSIRDNKEVSKLPRCS